VNRLTQPANQQISKSANQHKAIAAILVAFVLLSTTYSVVTPIFEAPDELQHYFFVQHLADGEGLPIITGPVPDIPSIMLWRLWPPSG
jgi:hypothetical protein